MKSQFEWYVAGPWDHKPQVYELIQKVQRAGWQTCSRWAEPDNPDIDPAASDYEAQRREQATRDVEDVVNADGLIYVNSKMSEGKATELGISIAMLKPIIIIGDRSTNIFLSLNMPCYPTIEEALAWLDGDGQVYLSFVQNKQAEHMMQTAQMFADFEEDGLEDMEFPSE